MEESELDAARRVLRDRGWLTDDSPPLPEVIGLLVDLLEGYQRSQETLRVELHNLQNGKGVAAIS